MNGKYVDVNYIIGELSDNFPFITDVSDRKVKEYIWKIIGRFGIEDAFYDRVATIDIVDQRGILPSDLFEFYEDQVREFESKRIMTQSTDTFFESENIESYVRVNQMANNETFCTIVPTDRPIQAFTYKISENHIFTGMLEGQVEITYKAFPTDKYGNPLVPDNEKIISAVVSFIAERYAYMMLIKDMLSERKYAMIEQEHYFNLASARSAAKIPNEREMHTIRNRIHSPNDGSKMFHSRFRDHGKMYYDYD